MNIEQRINSFLLLAKKMKGLDKGIVESLYSEAYIHNPWFTKENIDLAFEGFFRYLDEDKLIKWVKPYGQKVTTPKTIGVVMAGNIPMVGVHDFLTVLMSGHKLQAKLSAKDEVLLRFIADMLFEIDPIFKDYIQFNDKLQGYDAVIATGSDNTARYFEYYFSKVPHIIRKNRTSVAILSGEEDQEIISLLAGDVFQYFGMGCRNIAKIYIPESMQPENLLPAFQKYEHIADHHKYANNYYYNRSIFLVNQTPHIDSGFLLMQENTNLVSPLSVLYYENYKTTEDLKLQLSAYEEKIQCLISENAWYPKSLPFGEAQKPEVWDYADHVDTMDFLMNL